MRPKQYEDMTYTFDKVMHGVVWIIGGVLVFLLLKTLSGVLIPFLVAWLIAYLLNPIVVWFKKKMKLKSRILPVIIVLLFLVVALVCLGLMLVPTIIDEVIKGKALFMSFWEDKETQAIVQDMTNQLDIYFNGSDVIQMINVQTVQSAIEKLWPGVVGLVEGIWKLVAGLAVLVIVILYLIFIMLDYEKINEGFRKMVPIKYRTVVYGVFDDVEKGMNSYFRGQSLVALLVGVLFSIGFLIVGLPMAITVGLFIGVLNLVPYLQTIGLVPVALLAWVQSAETGTPFWIIAVECTAVFLVVQSTQDLFLVPKIMGKAMGLKPAIILLALAVWGSLLGFIGLIIALPATSLCISYYKRVVKIEEEKEERANRLLEENTEN